VEAARFQCCCKILVSTRLTLLEVAIANLAFCSGTGKLPFWSRVCRLSVAFGDE
jgi:hypothetical protein